MKNIALLTLASLLVASPVTLHAQQPEAGHAWLEDSLLIDIGYVFAGTKTKVSVGLDEIPELSGRIDLERDLELDDSEGTGAFNLRWRFGEKWSLATQYFGQSRTNTTVLERDIAWEDQVFRAGLEVTGGFDYDVYRLLFGRTFHSGPKHEFGAGLGLHWLELGTSIAGEAFIDGESIGQVSERVSAGAPLPNLGFWYTYAWNSRWAIRGRLDWLSASVGDYSGGLWNAQVGVNWAIFRNFGITASYNYFELDGDVEETAAPAADELRLRMGRSLEVEAAHGAGARRDGMVVLHEIERDAVAGQRGAGPRLLEVAARVAVARGHEPLDAGQWGVVDLHGVSLASEGALERALEREGRQ